VGAAPDEIIFVGSGSEANNTVLSVLSCPSAGCSCGIDGATEIVTSTIEHPCILEAVKCLAERGATVRYVGVDGDGKVDLDEFRSVVSERTRIVSIMLANNEIGTVQDVAEMADIAHERGALFHTDAVQAVGKIPVDVGDLDVDFLTISGHKLYGPKGVGALYVRKGVPFCPLIRGGHQEKGRRAGTENTLGIIGFGRAAEMRMQEMETEEPRIRALKEKLRAGIVATIPDVIFVGHPTDCLPNTLNVTFDGAEGEAILLYLDLAGIAVSTGSACASGSLDPSHVLLAVGLPKECAHGSVRISLGRESTSEQADYVLETLPGVIAKIRGMSTRYGESRA
jgi:cysteine desulfurase